MGTGTPVLARAPEGVPAPPPACGCGRRGEVGNGRDNGMMGEPDDGLASPAALASLALYFLALAAVGFAANRSARSAATSTDGYFLAERAVGWPAAAASLFASNIGAEHFVGLAGTGASSGSAVAFYELGAGVCLLALCYFFLPVYLSAGARTVPDYLEARYSPASRAALVAISLTLYILTKVGATLFAGGVVLREVAGEAAARFAPVLLIALTGLYTLAGGLKAVVWTEVLQTLTILLGGVLTLILALREAGGWDGVRDTLDGEVPDKYWHILRSAADEEYPWTAFATGYFVVSVWYWAVDQEIAQRVLAARGLAHGQAACVAASFLKLAPGFLMVFPGMISRAIQRQRRQGVYSPSGDSDEVDYDRALPWLVINVLPPVARGIVVAAMIAALMSSLASVFNSSATLLSVDVWAKLRPQASEAQLVWVGRLGVVLVATLSVAWLPIIPLLGSQLFIYVQRPPSYIAPPVLALYIWGMLPLPRQIQPESFGAGACLVLGVGAGAIRFVAEVAASIAGSDEKQALGWYTRMHFQYFAVLSFVFSSGVLLGAGPLLAMLGRCRAIRGRWHRLDASHADNGAEEGASNGFGGGGDHDGMAPAYACPDREFLLWHCDLRTRLMAPAASAAEAYELQPSEGSREDPERFDEGVALATQGMEALEIEDASGSRAPGARRRLCGAAWCNAPPRVQRCLIDIAAALYVAACTACVWLFG